ncbi:MAG: hypothetical protein ACFFED_11125 [Candidatus Thorarchaeota archaeon]
MSENVTDLERKILAVIIKDSHRPASITRILQGRQVSCDQNSVVQSLNALEKKGLVERYSPKTWIAKGKAEEYIV